MLLLLLLHGVSIPHRQAINLEKKSHSGTPCGCFNSSQVGYKQFNQERVRLYRPRVSIPHRQAINLTKEELEKMVQESFNSSQVGYKPNSLQPSQRYTGPVSIPHRQAINGFSQTESLSHSGVSIPHRQAINFIFLKFYIFKFNVSIPHRQAINQLQLFPLFLAYGFNSSQVGYKRYLPSNCRGIN